VNARIASELLDRLQNHDVKRHAASRVSSSALSCNGFMGSNDSLPVDLDDRIRRGDPAAFEALFRAHYQPMCAFAARYTDSSAVAEELVQDVFAAVWVDRSRWPAPANRRAYLLTAVRNRALNAGRRRRMEQDWVDAEILGGEPSVEASAVDDVPRRDDPATRVHLARAMTALPERCRLVMHLRWREGMSYADIAAVMGISAKGVENQLARGLRALRRAFGTD
jgi:RNA polymerase sigma-70 factor (ECF subfamily)